MRELRARFSGMRKRLTSGAATRYYASPPIQISRRSIGIDAARTPAFLVHPGQHRFKITGFYLLTGKELLRRREAENHSQHSSKCPMAPQDSVVEYQVLELSPFYRHDNGTVSAVQRCNDSRWPGFQLKGFWLAYTNAQSASETDFFVQLRQLLLWILRIIR